MLTEVALQHRVIPGIAEFARGGLPAPAATDGGNEWVDGLCWLYCGQRWTRVLWIGPARVAGAQARCTRAAPASASCRNGSGNPSSTRAARPSESAEVGQSTSGKRTGKHRGQSRLFRRS